MRYFTSSGIVIGSRAAGVLIGFATQLLLARILPVTELGIYFTVMSLAAVLSVFCTVGYPMIMPRFVAKAAKTKDYVKFSAFLAKARTDWIGMSFILVLLGGGLAAFWPALDFNLRASLIAGILTAPFLASLRLNGSLANALRRFALGFVPDLLIRPAVFSLLIIVFWYLMSGIDVISILLIHLAVASVLAAWQYFRIRRPFGYSQDQDDYHMPGGNCPEGVRSQAAFMLIAMLFVAVIADVGILSASVMLSNKELAIFAICLKISTICGFAVYAVQQISVRDAADAILDSEAGSLKSVLLRTNLTSLFIALTAFFFIYLFGEEILTFFGPQFAVGYQCLLILMTVNIFTALAGPTMQIIGIIGEEKSSSLVFLSAMILLFLLNLLLTPEYGLIGAGLAFMLTMMVWPFMLGYIISKKTGIHPANFIAGS
ncbi:MAG: polysaccharide biosynthesis C-terminal domain-containing protein [Pseudomonadota bacterium]